jgi:membrane fusion protein, multidrug efflux system
MKKRTRWLLLGTLGLMLAGGAGVFLANSSKKPEKPKEEKTLLVFAPNEIGQAANAVFKEVATAPGVLQAEHSALVRSKVSAVVQSITVREGDSVERGQVIATLDAQELTERVRVATGQLASAEARAANARQQRDTQKSLLDQGFISNSAFDSAQSSFVAAQGEVTALRAQLALAQQSLADTSLRSPMRGTVGKRLVNPGEKLGFDGAVVQIIDLSRLELQAFASPTIALQLKTGQSVSVQIEGSDKAVIGELTRVLPAVDSSTRQLPVMIRVANPQGALKSGLNAQAKITLGERSVLAVPSTAIANINGENYIFTLSADNAVARQKVEAGTRDEARSLVEITSSKSLKAGERVLLGRYEGLVDGQKVATAPVAAASKPAKP